MCKVCFTKRIQTKCQVLCWVVLTPDGNRILREGYGDWERRFLIGRWANRPTGGFHNLLSKNQLQKPGVMVRLGGRVEPRRAGRLCRNHGHFGVVWRRPVLLGGGRSPLWVSLHCDAVGWIVFSEWRSDSMGCCKWRRMRAVPSPNIPGRPARIYPSVVTEAAFTERSAIRFRYEICDPPRGARRMSLS